MAGRVDAICGSKIKFKDKKGEDQQRLKDGFKKFREALERDAQAAAARGSGLPKNWRSRILG